MYSTNALRQIRALGNVSDQAATTTQTDKKKKKKKRSKRSKKDKKDTALVEDDGTASDGAMQVEKKSKTKEKHNEVQQSGVTDCCICECWQFLRWEWDLEFKQEDIADHILFLAYWRITMLSFPLFF